MKKHEILKKHLCDRCKKIYQSEDFLGEDFIFKAYWHNKEGYENSTYWWLCPNCIKSFEKWLKKRTNIK